MKKVKKFITCIISLFVICICPYMVQADQINFGDSIEISTEYGRYKLQIDNVHEVDWDWAVEDRKEMKIVTVQCVVENLNHTGAFEEGAIANWEIGMKGILITDQDGFGLEFFNISGGDDGAYEVGAMTSVGSKKRVSLPYYAPEDCTKITVTVDGKYMLEMSLDEKNEISGENIGSEDKDSSEIDSLLKEKKNLETKNQELIDENKKLKFEKLQLQDKVQQLEVENEKIKKKNGGYANEIENVKVENNGELETDDITTEAVEVDASEFLYVVNNGETYIKSYNGSATDIIIPNEIDGGIVTTIGEKAFEKNEKLHSVILPENIETIGDEAFHGCKALEKLEFPKKKISSLTIGKEAIYQCNLKGTVVLNAENLTLGIRAFSLNYEITDMILMANNITFHDSPFTYCKGIKRLYVNPNATVSYDGQYLNSAEGDVFEELESLAEVILPGDCGFLSENSFVGTPKATIYAPSGSSTIQSANELWIPTNSDKFDDKLASVKEQLINLGYESIIEEQTTVEEQNTNEKISSTENRTSEVIFNDSETIKWVQEELNSLGYGCGTPDGIAGEKTQNAIRNYKTNNGMHDDCEITQELLDSFANNQPTTGYANSEIHEIISSGLKNLATENFEISGPVTQEDNGTVAYGYNLLYNKVKAMMIVNPDFEGRVKVGFIPVSISNDTSSAKDFFNLVAYTIQSLDDSISYDSAFNTVDTACIDGKNEINGILCEYSAPNFFVTY